MNKMSTDHKNWIHFYMEKDLYPELSNFYIHNEPLLIDGSEFRSVEHYYQCMKFSDNIGSNSEYFEIIRIAKTPYMAKILASQKCTLNYEWTVSLRQIILQYRDKVSQDLHCKQTLLGTSDKILSENSGERDKYWGNSVKNSFNPDKIGKLGLLLMTVRNELYLYEDQISDESSLKTKTKTKQEDIRKYLVSKN